MEIKWYWLAEKLGLMKDITTQYADGSIHYEVSVKAEEFFTVLTWSMLPALFLIGLISCFLAGWKKRKNTGKTIVYYGIVILLVYAVLLAVGIGPYIEFYPRGGSFIDFSVLEHIVEGIYCALLALALFLGGRVGMFLRKKIVCS